MNEKLLVGLGLSNEAVANYLDELELDFSIYIDSPIVEHRFSGKMISSITDINWNNISEVIKSPGIPHSHPVLVKAAELSLPVTNEIGFTTRFFRGELIAITGTNGKTTTTSLVTHLLKVGEEEAIAVGNIGKSFLESYLNDSAEYYVAELSSFQLKDLKSFNPTVAAILNLKSAHLDYHSTIEDYHNSKKNIFVNQDPKNLLVYNGDEEHLLFPDKVREGFNYKFSLVDNSADCYFDGEYIYLFGEPIVHRDSLMIKGIHNIQNAMAAILIACNYVSKSDLNKGLRTFEAVEHRLEKLSVEAPVEIFNDSKSTNSTATKAALSAFAEPVVLMMGGLDRGNDFAVLNDYWGKTSDVICFGESAEKVYQDAHIYTNAVVVKDISEAIELAKTIAYAKGHSLVFSPGCASWDAFKSYEERGRFFKSHF